MRRMLFHVILAYTTRTDISIHLQNWQIPELTHLWLPNGKHKAFQNPKWKYYSAQIKYILTKLLYSMVVFSISGTLIWMIFKFQEQQIGWKWAIIAFFFFFKQNTRREKHFSHSKVLWWNYKLLKNCIYNGNADRPFTRAVWMQHCYLAISLTDWRLILTRCHFDSHLLLPVRMKTAVYSQAASCRSTRVGQSHIVSQTPLPYQNSPSTNQVAAFPRTASFMSARAFAAQHAFPTCYILMIWENRYQS